MTQTTDLSRPDWEKFIAYITEQAASAPDGSEISARILEATTVEDVLGNGQSEVLKARDVLGIPLMVMAVRFQASDYQNDENPLPAYMILECATTQGEKRIVVNGSQTVMTQIYKLITMDALPAPVIFRQVDRATRGGFRPMYLDNGAKAFEAGF